jgi:hypothetical protein
MFLLLMLCIGMAMFISPFQMQGAPLQFESHESLEAWAGSAVGGGRLYEVGPEAPGLYYADRSFTSGVYSSELAVYIQAGDGYTLVLYLPLKRMVQRRVRVQDEALIIEERPQGQAEGAVEMMVPLRMLGGF